MPSSYNSFAFRAHQKRQKYPVYDIFGYVEKMLYVVLVSRRHGAPCHIDLCSLDRTFQSRFTQRFLMLISTAADFHLVQCSQFCDTSPQADKASKTRSSTSHHQTIQFDFFVRCILMFTSVFAIRSTAPLCFFNFIIKFHITLEHIAHAK